jgi:catalase
VKWHLKKVQGIECLTSTKAAEIAGEDLDHHRRDLYAAIERGEHPKWSDGAGHA